MAKVQCDQVLSEIRLSVGQFMDEIMKHPHAYAFDFDCYLLSFNLYS